MEPAEKSDKKPIYNKLYYEEKREKILADSKNKTNENKIECLIAENYPIILASFARITKNLTIKLKSLDQFDNLLSIRADIKEARDKLRNNNNENYYNGLKEEVLETVHITKLKNRITLLKKLGYPILLCSWATINMNKKDVTLTFDSPEVFDKFVAIMDDLYNIRQNERLLESPN